MIETKIAQTLDLSMSRVSGTPSINLSPFQITPVKLSNNNMKKNNNLSRQFIHNRKKKRKLG